MAISVPRLIPERVRKRMRDRLITVSFHHTCFVALSRRADETHEVPFLQGSSHVILCFHIVESRVTRIACRLTQDDDIIEIKITRR